MFVDELWIEHCLEIISYIHVSIKFSLMQIYDLIIKGLICDTWRIINQKTLILRFMERSELRRFHRPILSDTRGDTTILRMCYKSHTACAEAFVRCQRRSTSADDIAVTLNAPIVVQSQNISKYGPMVDFEISHMWPGGSFTKMFVRQVRMSGSRVPTQLSTRSMTRGNARQRPK